MIFFQIFSPLILTVGIFGNLVNYFVFTNKKMINMPTFKFLAHLSLIDCLYILIGVPHIILVSFKNFDIRNTSNIICSIHSFLTIYFSHLSSNVLAAISVYRCFEITKLKNQPTPKMPLLKNENSKTLKRDKTISYSENKSKNFHFLKVDFILLVICLILFLIDSHYLVFMRLTAEYENNSNETDIIKYICYPSSESNYYWFIVNVWHWIDMFLYSYIPFLIMITSSFLISIKLYKNSKNFIKNKRDTKKIHKDIEMQPICHTIEVSTENTRKHILEKQIKRRTRRNNQVYKLLILLNITFFILVTPVVLFNSFDLLNSSNGFILEIIYIFAYMNHCFNFLFYCFSCELYKLVLKSKYQKIKNFIKFK